MKESQTNSSQNFTPNLMENTVEELEFANPKLAEIGIKAQNNSTKAYVKGIIFEIISWFAIPIGIPLSLSVGILVFGLVYAVPYALLKSALDNNLLATINIFCIIGAILLSIAGTRFTIPVFFRLRRDSKKYRRNVQLDLRKDARDPVLYLRSFLIDSTENIQRISRKTHEEDLSVVLQDIGPVLTVGKPSETFLLGAKRIYLETKGWEKKVEKLIGISQLVVIHAGISESLLTEFKLAKKYEEPSKLLVSFLFWDFNENDRQFHYAQFKKEFEKIFGIDLPEKIGEANFLVFQPDWKSVLIQPSKWKKFFFNLSSSTLLRETLRPVLSKRGLKLRWAKTISYCGIYIFAIILSLFLPIPFFPLIFILLSAQIIRYFYPKFNNWHKKSSHTSIQSHANSDIRSN